MIIATHNTEFLFDAGAHTHSGEQWIYSEDFVNARVAHFSNLFTQINADILLLQEVGSRSVIEKIIEQSGMNYSCYFANPDNIGVGNVVLYKSDTIECESIPAVSSLPVFVEGDFDNLGSRIWPRRDFVHIKTIYNTKPLHILGIHIKSNFLMPLKTSQGSILPMADQITTADGLIRSEIFRFSQAKKLRQIIDNIFSTEPDAMVIVAGDFNASVNDSVYRIIKGIIPDKPDSLVATTSKIDQTLRFTMAASNDKPARSIDHILVSKNIKPLIKDVKILNSNLPTNHDTAPNPTSVASDHAPIVIELA